MATSLQDLIKKVKSEVDQRIVPIQNSYNQINSTFQRINNPPIRQMYNQLPQTLEPLRRTYNTVNQGLREASAYRQAVPLQQRVQIAGQDMRVNPIKYSLPGQIAQLPNRPAQMFGKAYEGILEGLSAGLIDIPARPSQNNFERGAYVGGNLLGMFNPSSPLMRGGKILSKAPVISQTQRPLGQLASKLIAQGGGRKLAGKALANVSQGIPYTTAYMAGKQALSPLTGRSYTKGDLATDVGFDAALGAGAGLLGVGAPLAMGLTKSAKNLPNPKGKIKLPKTDPLEALKQEARKYKSAEEFVKAQGTSNLYNVGDSFEMGKIIENPFKEGLPSAKKVQEINRYLQANKDKYNPKYVKFYHGTAKGLPIEEKGLLPTSTTRRKSYQSESGYVYLANTPERAKTFGDLGNMSNSDVYEVVVPVNKLLPDLDQLNNLRSTGEKIGNTLGDSIVYGGGVRIKGKIEPYAVRKLPENTKTKSQLTDLYNQSQLQPKIKPNQIAKGRIPVLPETQMGITQSSKPLVNTPKPLMSQGTPTNQLLQQKTIPGNSPSNNQAKVQSLTFDDIIAEGRKSIGSTKPEVNRPVKQVLHDIYTQWVDRYHPLSRASKQAKNVLRVKGAELRPEFDPDYLVRRLTGAGGIADSKFNSELKPIIDEVDQLGIPKLDMDTYLAHKRMAGFGDIGREVYGADPVKSKQITTALEAKYPEISEVANRFYRYQDQGLQELVDAGFISQDAVKKIRSQNPDYAPLYRVMDEMDEYLELPTRKTMQGSNPVTKIKGSKRQIESPIESIIGNTFRQRAAIEKNRVAQSIVGLNKVADMGFRKVAKSGADTITVWNNGVKEYWQVGKDIADMAKGVNEEVTNTLLKIIQAPAQLLRQGATGRNPAFIFPNMVRDQLDAGITSKYGYIPFVDYVSGLKSMLKNDEVYKKWQNSGAKIDLGELSGKKSVAQLFDEKKSKKRLYQWITAVLDVMGKYSEQPTRVGLFKKAYKKTGNELLSAMESRDATVDFARMGSKMKVANSIIPFLNVGVQGFDKLIRATKNNPKKVLLNMGIYSATPAIVVTAYNLQNFPQEYEEIPQYEKDSNFVIVKGRNAEGLVDYIKIPKGNIVPIVANPIQSFMEYLAGVDGKSFSELVVSLFSDTLPVLEGGNTPKEVLVKTTGSMIPQFAKPIIEDITNKSFYKYDAKKEAQGRESGVIVPDYLKKKAPYEQAYEFTPEMYKKIGAVLNVSPLRVKNMMEGYLAGYAKIPSQVIQMLDSASRGEPISPNDKTILSRFVGQTYPTSSSTKKEVEVKQSPGLMDRVTAKADASTAPVSIPTDQDTFTELYKKALSSGTDFSIKKALIEADPTLDEYEKKEKIDKLRTNTSQWAETLITMQDKYPKQVFRAELKAYGKNSSFDVQARSEWAKKQLNTVRDEKELQAMLNEMWDSGVLTTGSKGTAEYLKDELGIDVYLYTGSNSKIKNKVSKGKKGKKVKLGATPKIDTVVIRARRSSFKPVQIKVRRLSTPQIRIASKKPSMSLLEARKRLQSLTKMPS